MTGVLTEIVEAKSGGWARKNGAKHSPSSVLLVGPPGKAKASTAECLVEEPFDSCQCLILCLRVGEVIHQLT